MCSAGRQFRFAAASDAGSGLAGYELRVAGKTLKLAATATSATLPARSTAKTPLVLVALDRAGNRSVPVRSR